MIYRIDYCTVYKRDVVFYCSTDDNLSCKTTLMSGGMHWFMDIVICNNSLNDEFINDVGQFLEYKGNNVLSDLKKFRDKWSRFGIKLFQNKIIPDEV